MDAEVLARSESPTSVDSVGVDGLLRPGTELRERSTQARIILTNYVSTLTSWRFRMAPGSFHGDLTVDPLITDEMLRRAFERVKD
jgi:hypothetical protein